MVTFFSILQYLGVFLFFIVCIYGLYSLIRLRIKIFFITVVIAFIIMLFSGCCEQVKVHMMSPQEQAQYKSEKEADKARRAAKEQAEKEKEASEKRAEEEKIAAEKAQKAEEAKAKAEKEAAEKAEREAKADAERERKENTISLGDSPDKVKRLKGEPNSEKKQTTNEGRFLWYTYYKNGIDHEAGTITYQFHNSSLASITEY